MYVKIVLILDKHNNEDNNDGKKDVLCVQRVYLTSPRMIFIILTYLQQTKMDESEFMDLSKVDMNKNICTHVVF